MRSSSPIVTAAMLAIGDELLSGRTKDKNISYLAEELSKIGIEFSEARIVPDRKQAIIDAINALRARYDYLFTSGGIGPTHDDITAQSVSEALELPCIFDAEAEKILSDYYQARKLPFTEGRHLMARMPEGSEHIANPISVAPGFHIKNVFVMAGVPQIFQAMVQNILPKLTKGLPFQSLVIPCPFGESVISALLAEIQRDYPQTSIGSYPQFNDRNDNTFSIELVVRSRDTDALQQAAKAVENMVAALKKNS